jgi:hypothetical protein
MELERGYLDNPYHNACHAADVSHTLIYFFTMSDIQHYITSFDLFAGVIAALAHDFAHPGLTNRFLVNV